MRKGFIFIFLLCYVWTTSAKGNEKALVARRFEVEAPLEASPDSNERQNRFLLTFRTTVSSCRRELRVRLSKSTKYYSTWKFLEFDSDRFVLVRNQGKDRDCSYRLIKSVSAPPQEGRFELVFDLVNEERTIANATVVIEVTCTASVANFCDGEKRFIVAGKNKGRCVRTYKPCGQETAAGVQQTDPCLRYECDPVKSSCSRNPVGGDTCESCFLPPCVPNCDGKACGDDGCGGVCDPNNLHTPQGCPDGQFCLENGDTFSCVSCQANCIDRVCGDDSCGSSCGTCASGLLCSGQGQCVEKLPGSCQQPYPLFGNSLAPGELNPSDLEGVELRVLNNGPVSTEPASPPVDSSNRASLGLPDDGESVPVTGVRVRLKFNSLGYADSVLPEGNGENIPDVVFRFRITAQAQGMEAYLLGGDGSVERDTFLAMVKNDCTNYKISDPGVTPADVLRSDDAAPPGGVGSRILRAAMPPGEYLIVATTYNRQNSGPLWLEVVFTDSSNGACAPICAGHFCGSNGCGGVCNIQGCSAGLNCVNARCSSCPVPLPANFAPNCTNGDGSVRSCGQDADLCFTSTSTCGSCTQPNSFCEFQNGQCVTVPPCDTFAPVCNTDAVKKEKQKSFWCDSKCNLKELNDPVIEILTNDEPEIRDSFVMHWRYFDVLSCAIQESCVSSPGWQLLLRYDTNIHNIGNAIYTAPKPEERPDELVYATCHQHFHQRGFASYFLSNITSSERATYGGKLSYCVATNAQYQTGPKVLCAAASETTCQAQGLEPGNTDAYTSDLDCQWTELTGLYQKKLLNRWYMYHISTNEQRNIPEYSRRNNAYAWPVFIPCAPPKTEAVSYVRYLEEHPEVCCSRPAGPFNAAGPDPVLCPGPVGGCAGVAPRSGENCPVIS